jgi:hypothetical protein
MTLKQALPWNVRTCPFDDKGNRQVADTASGNTEARDRGGVARSSEEASVMGVERRGDSTEGDGLSQPPWREELGPSSKPFATPQGLAWLGKGSRVSREGAPCHALQELPPQVAGVQGR